MKDRRWNEGERITNAYCRQFPYLCYQSVRTQGRPLREALCCSYTSFLALLDTTSRAMGGNLPCAGAHHGNLTPPRISPSCFRRSTIIGWRDHGGAACQSCLGLSGYRSAPYMAVLWCRILCTGGLRALGLTLSFSGPSADVCKLPDITAIAVFFKVRVTISWSRLNCNVDFPNNRRTNRTHDVTNRTHSLTVGVPIPPEM